MSKALYHTIRKDRIVAASVKNAPYRCVNSPWLGEGYYFWDSFVELAHWWGNVHWKGNYVITETDMPFSDGEVFDLVGNTEHISVFAQYAQILENEFGEEPTVAQVVEHMKKHTDFLNTFKAIRADGRFSISDIPDNAPYINRLKFCPDHPHYLDLLPPIQYCVFEKTNLNQLKIVYKSESTSGKKGK